MKLMNLRSEFYLCQKEIGFRKAVLRFNAMVAKHGYKELDPSDWGKFLQGSPTRLVRQAAKKIRRCMPAIVPRVCHSTRVCWQTPDIRCNDAECPVNK